MTSVTNPIPPGEPGAGTAVAERPATAPPEIGGWVCLVWDDPVNLMSYVTHVFAVYFGYPREKAERLMLQVHREGRSAVATGTREEMERAVGAMHGFGLWATLERAE